MSLRSRKRGHWRIQPCLQFIWTRQSKIAIAGGLPPEAIDHNRNRRRLNQTA
jgi:hypothetical protein